MNARNTPRRSPLRRLFRLRNLLPALVVLVVVVYLVWPERIHNIVTVDGQFRWTEDAAPPRYKIVWQEAYQIELPTPGIEREGSLIRPQFAEEGTVLYFTWRSREGDADIYRSVLEDRAWLPAEPVEQLNSDAHDIGPVISPDGKRAYLYSDRPGGFGNCDIYVSERTPGGWSTPRNLGRRINSPADERSPAISADRTRLYFASNQTGEMLRRPSDIEPGDEWSVTPRADQGLARFDLYAARREKADDDWASVEPLDKLNRPDADEGDPYLAPSGAFLYFVSNRTVREGEPTNFDIYRARIRGDRLSDVENLGSGVNTPANELEPALSPEGFRLLFSRNELTEEAEPRVEEKYAVYCSEASEIIEEVGWGKSKLAWLLAFLLRNWWWIVLFLLTLALLAALVWYLREVSLRRLPVPGFFLAALLIHVLLGLGSFYVYFGPGIYRYVKRELEDVVVALSFSSEHLHQSHEAGQEAYEKVADLRSVEGTEPGDVTRQVTEMPGVPIPTESPLPELPTKLSRDLPSDRLTLPPPEAEIDTDTPELQRRRALQQMLAEQIELERTQAAKQAPEQLARVQLDIDRRRTALRAAATPKMLPRRTISPTTLIEPEEVTAERGDEGPVQADTDQQPAIERTARTTPEPPAVAEVPTEALGAPAAQTPARGQPAGVAVNVGRREPAAPVGRVPGTFRGAAAVAAAVQPGEEEIQAEGVGPEPVGTTGTDQQPTTLKRTMRPAAGAGVAAADAPVETEALGPPVAGPKPEAGPAEVNVNVGRRQTTTPIGGGPTVLRRSSALGSGVQPAVEDVAAERVSEGPVAIAVGPPADGPLAAKRTRAPVLPAADSPQPIETAALSGPTGTGGTGEVFTPQGVGVKVARQATAGPSAPSTSLRLAGPERGVGPAGLGRPSERPVEVGTIAAPDSGKAVARLARATRVGEPGIIATDVGTIATEQPGAAGVPAAAGGGAIAGVDVGIDRPDAELFQVPVKTSGRLGGLHLARADRLVVGSLENEAIDAPPTFSPHASRITRRPARAPLLLYAEDNIGLQAMFRLRGGEAKLDLLEAFGGDKQTLEAVRRGLQWLKKHQHNDGYWSLHEFYNPDKGKHYSGKASVKSDTAATGFALLPFLGDGHTHVEGQYQSTVRKGVQWLVEHQKENGDLATTTGHNTHMYGHAIAAIALCEAYGMTKDEKLREPAQRAIEFIVEAQHKPSGGWRYNPNQEADTSVVGWQVMALKSAQMAALSVSQQCLDLVPKWLRSVERQTGRYEYQRGRGVTPAMTAEALLCVQYLGADRNDPRLRAGADYLLENLPGKNKVNSYYWYYATQVMYHMQGEPWQQWNNALRDMLVETQVKDGHLSGTWDPAGEWEDRAGRLYGTSLRLLMLEVYYRHLPLYQIFEQ